MKGQLTINLIFKTSHFFFIQTFGSLKKFGTLFDLLIDLLGKKQALKKQNMMLKYNLRI